MQVKIMEFLEKRRKKARFRAKKGKIRPNSAVFKQNLVKFMVFKENSSNFGLQRQHFVYFKNGSRYIGIKILLFIVKMG